MNKLCVEFSPVGPAGRVAPLLPVCPFLVRLLFFVTGWGAVAFIAVLMPTLGRKGYG